MTGHRIRRQRWHVKAPGPGAAFALRGRLRADVEPGLQPLFEQAFDALGTGEQVVRIPRLALAIRVPLADAPADAFLEPLREQLALALREWALALPPETLAASATPAASRRDALLLYLSSGLVPWYGEARTPEQWRAVLGEEARRFASDAAEVATALRAARSSEAAASRLLQLLRSDERAALVICVCRAAAAATPAGRILPRAMALARAVDVSGLAPRHSLPLLAAALAAASSGDARPLAAAWSAVRASPSSPAMAAIPVELRRSLEGDGQGEGTPGQGKPRSEPPSPSNDPSSTPRASSPGAASAEAPAGFTVHDAGLVLLHPYLPRLFEATAVAWDAKSGIAEHSLARAAALLHWLATGREEALEFELATAKLLLGLDPGRELSLPPGLLGEDERAEGDALLDAVRGHWSALGGTSRDGLRATFLQRRAIVRGIPEGWHVQVEPGAYDVLLAKMPWTFNLVSLPWMTRPVFIDWPTP